MLRPITSNDARGSNRPKPQCVDLSVGPDGDIGVVTEEPAARKEVQPRRSVVLGNGVAVLIADREVAVLRPGVLR